MKIIKGKENGSIRNNYIYLSDNIINEFSLYDNKDKVIRLTNIKNSTTIYTKWNGGLINNSKEDCVEFSSFFCKDKNIEEEYFYFELTEGESIEKLTLTPLNNNDFLSVDSYSDFFEEEFLNQIAIVYNKEIIPFYLPFDNKICFLQANIDKNFGRLSEDCEITIQYIPPKEEKEIYTDKKRIVKIDSFKKKIDDLFTLNRELFYLTLKEEDKNSIWRYCDEKNILSGNKTSAFPYQKGFWIGKEMQNEISLPKFVIMNCAFFINDSLSYQKFTIDEIIKNRELYYKYIQSEIKISFFSNNNSITSFKTFLLSLKPFIFTNNFVYQFDNYIFSIQLQNSNKEDFSAFSSFQGDFPILLDNNIDISLCKIVFSNDLYLKFSYALLYKNKRYLSLKNIENERINKSLLTVHKKEIIDVNIEPIINNINLFFSNRDINNNNILIFAPKVNIYSYLNRINTYLKKNNYKYLYIDLSIFDCNHLSLEKYKKIKEYVKECLSIIETNDSKYILLIKNFYVREITNKDEQSQIIRDTLNEFYFNKVQLFLYSLLSKAQKEKQCFIINIFENDSTNKNLLQLNICNKIYYIKETLTQNHFSTLQKLNPEISQSIIGSSWSDFIQSQVTLKNQKNEKNSCKDYTFSSVCNMGKVKEQISDMLTLPTKFKELFPNQELPIQLSKGCLLIGPSGCGKTYIANSLKNEFKINFFSIKATDILGKYIGQSESAIRDIFLKAKEKTPCVLFFDNIEALTPVRGSSNGINDRIVNQFLTYLDGVEERKEVFVIAATSNPYLIDPAIRRPGRLDSSLLCDYPNLDEKVEAFMFYLKQIGNKEVKQSEIKEFCKGLNYYTYADVNLIVYNAYMIKVKEAIEKKKDKEVEEIDIESLKKGVEQLNKRLNYNEIELYNEIRNKMNKIPSDSSFMKPDSKQTFI